jgi:NADPH:quinone reductase-like Zn-dependent oxidoreductase
MNPLTALLLLTEFKTLKAGNWVISTSANSAVGRSVIPIAKARGIKTVNIVRTPDLLDEIKAAGGDVVLPDGPNLAKRISAATGGADIQLALDGVGGPLTQQLIEAIGLYGSIVLWSRMGGVDPTTSSDPATIRICKPERRARLACLVSKRAQKGLPFYSSPATRRGNLARKKVYSRRALDAVVDPETSATANKAKLIGSARDHGPIVASNHAPITFRKAKNAGLLRRVTAFTTSLILIGIVALALTHLRWMLHLF